MAYTTINKPDDYFNTKLYTGTASTNAQTGIGFQPDWVWLKARSYFVDHLLVDSMRGTDKYLKSNGVDAEQTSGIILQSFDSDGFTLGNSDDVNRNSETYASWNWKANGSGSSNTAGSINSTVSVNTTSGFSIVKYTGTESLATVGHGLGMAPKMILIKDLSYTRDWAVYHQAMGNTYGIYLNLTNAQGGGNSDFWGSTSPTSTVFTINTRNENNNNGSNYIAYCFSDVQGFSKMGSYVGNGNADGPFIYTGFKPSFVMIKNASISTNWVMIDNKRPGFNSNNYFLSPNLYNAETTNYGLEILSNGFKPLTNLSWINESGSNIIYMAFGQSLVGTNNIPNNAR